MRGSPLDDLQQAIERLKFYYASEIRISPILLIADWECVAKEYLRQLDLWSKMNDDQGTNQETDTTSPTGGSRI